MKIVIQLSLVAEFLPDEMAAVGGRIDQHIIRAFSQSSFQNSLQILIFQLVILKGQIIHVNDKLVIAVLDLLQNI